MDLADDGIGLLLQVVNLGIIFIELGILPAILLAYYLLNDEVIGLIFLQFHIGCGKYFDLESIGLTICENGFFVLQSLAYSLGVFSGAYNIFLYVNFTFIYASCTKIWLQKLQ